MWWSVQLFRKRERTILWKTGIWDYSKWPLRFRHENDGVRPVIFKLEAYEDEEEPVFWFPQFCRSQLQFRIIQANIRMRRSRDYLKYSLLRSFLPLKNYSRPRYCFRFRFFCRWFTDKTVIIQSRLIIKTTHRTPAVTIAPFPAGRMQKRNLRHSGVPSKIPEVYAAESARIPQDITSVSGMYN